MKPFDYFGYFTNQTIVGLLVAVLLAGALVWTASRFRGVRGGATDRSPAAHI